MATQVLLPRSYVCPISGDIMNDPWSDPEGNTYEKAMITQWLGSNSVSPVTRTHLVQSMLRPNCSNSTNSRIPI